MTRYADPVARQSDPATSHQAAKLAKAWAPSHRERILGVLWRPMTAAKIATLTGLTVVQVDRRLPELEAAGEARVTGEVRDGMRVWERILQV